MMDPSSTQEGEEALPLDSFFERRLTIKQIKAISNKIATVQIATIAPRTALFKLGSSGTTSSGVPSSPLLSVK